MYATRLYLATVLSIFIFLFCGQAIAQIQARYIFQDRGDRHEGIAEILVASHSISLLSAIVIHNENVSGTDVPKFKLMFLLDKESDVYVTVRGYRTSYKMVPNRRKWSPLKNSFSWPTETVLRNYDIKLNDLGAVASIGDNSWGKVAPVALFANNPPGQVQGYEFTFSVDTAVRVSYKWVKDDDLGPNNEGSLMKERKILQPVPGRSFTLQWDGTDLNGQAACDGSYKLVLRLRRISNDSMVQPYPRQIRFTHRQTFN